MLKKLITCYDRCFNLPEYWLKWYTPTSLIVAQVANNSQEFGGFIRKGQRQMMADYLWLELLEQGRL